MAVRLSEGGGRGGWAEGGGWDVIFYLGDPGTLRRDGSEGG